jgi:signal peptide peptidase SppA
MTMRTYGPNLLQSFADGNSLICPERMGALRALADNASTGSSLVASITSALGLSVKRAREEGIVSLDAACSAMGLQITDRNKPFAFSNGIAVIPVWGCLLHRDGWCDEYATGYDFIRSKFNAAMADPDVKGIVFDINSPGGHVAGNFELADDIYAARSQKPSLAIIDSMCYSGGYSLGSSASRLVSTPSGGAGSIGVVCMHVSVEKLMDKHGVAVTYIHAGKHKVDGNPFNDLPADVRARYQASIDKSYEKFVSLVARNRGMEAGKVRKTEALCYDADEALTVGLIDAIQTPKEALAAFRRELFGSSTIPNQGAQNMSDTTNPGAGGESNTPAPNAEAPNTPAPDAATQPTAEEITKAANARSAAIINSEEAKGREDLANHLAFETTMSVEDARKMLAKAPKAAKSVSAFEAAMNNGDNPNVGADDGSSGGESNTSVKVGARIAQSYGAVTGGNYQRER